MLLTNLVENDIEWNLSIWTLRTKGNLSIKDLSGLSVLKETSVLRIYLDSPY